MLKLSKFCYLSISVASYLSGCGGQQGSVDCSTPTLLTKGEYAQWSVQSDRNDFNVEITAQSAEELTLAFDSGREIQYSFQSDGYCEAYSTDGEETVSGNLIVYGHNSLRQVVEEFLDTSIQPLPPGVDAGPLGEPVDCEDISTEETLCTGTYEFDNKVFEWERRTLDSLNVPASGIVYFDVKYLGESIFTLSLAEWNGL